MIRLNKENINTPELSDKIFAKIWGGCPHDKDQNRFDDLAKHYKGGRYLEIGCFNSPKPGQLADNPNNEVWALDHAKHVVKEMKKIYPSVNYVVGDLYSTPFRDGYFDYISAGEVIEHLEDPTSFIDEMFRILSPNGIFALSTPFEEGISQTIITTEHLWGFSKEDIEGFLYPYTQDVESHVNTDNTKVIIAYAKI
jgi:ubiquinone/menaquinone biosynthesis C-methylase UbiE